VTSGMDVDWVREDGDKICEGDGVEIGTGHEYVPCRSLVSIHRGLQSTAPQYLVDFCITHIGCCQSSTALFRQPPSAHRPTSSVVTLVR